MDKSIIVMTILLLLGGCATYNGPKSAVQVLECTERMSDRTGAHVVDSSDVCLKAYKYADTPRSKQ